MAYEMMEARAENDTETAAKGTAATNEAMERIYESATYAGNATKKPASGATRAAREATNPKSMVSGISGRTSIFTGKDKIESMPV
jgi:hypothetical protein